MGATACQDLRGYSEAEFRILLAGKEREKEIGENPPPQPKCWLKSPLPRERVPQEKPRRQLCWTQTDFLACACHWVGSSNRHGLQGNRQKLSVTSRLPCWLRGLSSLKRGSRAESLGATEFSSSRCNFTFLFLRVKKTPPTFTFFWDYFDWVLAMFVKSLNSSEEFNDY